MMYSVEGLRYLCTFVPSTCEKNPNGN